MPWKLLNEPQSTEKIYVVTKISSHGMVESDSYYDRHTALAQVDAWVRQGNTAFCQTFVRNPPASGDWALDGTQEPGAARAWLYVSLDAYGSTITRAFYTQESVDAFVEANKHRDAFVQVIPLVWEAST